MGDMVSCGASLRKLSAEDRSMEEIANSITQYFYDNFRVIKTGETAFALVRFFKTHPYSKLPQDLQSFASEVLAKEGHTTSESESQNSEHNKIQCLTLLGTRGDQEVWNSRETSEGHQAIPLCSDNFVQSIPMISGVIKQLGLKISDVVKPDTSIQIENQTRKYNIFHVPEARGSALIPAQQEFVIPFGIQSVIGFGGLLPSKNVFVTIIFSKIKISQDVALLFKPLALSVKDAILLSEKRVFTL
tara:strand:+ start:2393 stop:3127 length:735 start_codon:yes stop_codon:yes gene_type:complete